MNKFITYYIASVIMLLVTLVPLGYLFYQVYNNFGVVGFVTISLVFSILPAYGATLQEEKES